jgi:carbon monoxide dehydrogenase subunit G
MPSFEHTIDVAAPIDQVFTFSTDPENWRRTTPSMTDIEIVEETDDGLRMTVTYELLGRPIHGEIEFEILPFSGAAVLDADRAAVRRVRSLDLVRHVGRRHDQ